MQAAHSPFSSMGTPSRRGGGASTSGYPLSPHTSAAIQYPDGRTPGTNTALQDSLVDHEMHTSYLDQTNNFYTGSTSEVQEEPRRVPDLLAALSSHETRNVGPGTGSSRHVVTSRIASGNEERPSDVALKNVLLLTHNLPADINSTDRHQIRPGKKPKINYAREKWKMIDFTDKEAVKFSDGLNTQIMERRREYAAANATVTFPEKVPNEALKYARPRFGLEWETFDSEKHLDYDAKQQMDQRRARLKAIKDDIRKDDEAAQAASGGAGWVFEEVAPHDDDDDEAVLPMNIVNGTVDLTKTGGDGKAAPSNNPNERSTALSQLYASATPQPDPRSGGGGSAAGFGSPLRTGHSSPPRGSGAAVGGAKTGGAAPVLSPMARALLAAGAPPSTVPGAESLVKVRGKNNYSTVKQQTVNIGLLTPFFETTIPQMDPVQGQRDYSKRIEEMPLHKFRQKDGGFESPIGGVGRRASLAADALKQQQSPPRPQYQDPNVATTATTPAYDNQSSPTFPTNGSPMTAASSHALGKQTSQEVI